MCERTSLFAIVVVVVIVLIGRVLALATTLTLAGAFTLALGTFAFCLAGTFVSIVVISLYTTVRGIGPPCTVGIVCGPIAPFIIDIVGHFLVFLFAALRSESIAIARFTVVVVGIVTSLVDFVLLAFVVVFVAFAFLSF